MDAPSRFPHHREFTRVRLPITALVTMNGVTQSVPVRDVCLEGIGVHVADSIDEGTTCTVELRRADAPEERWITAYGTVVHIAGDVAGIHFLHLLGIDSLNHLRALIMYHAEDPDQVLAEFDTHWGLRPR